MLSLAAAIPALAKREGNNGGAQGFAERALGISDRDCRIIPA
jgi:hypothetical protein